MPVQTERDHVGQRIGTLMLCAAYQKSLRFSCTKCPHVAVQSSVPIWWLFERKRWDGRLSAAVKRFYCSSCMKLRQIKVHDPQLVVCDDYFTADAIPWPDGRPWKKTVARYRT